MQLPHAITNVNIKPAKLSTDCGILEVNESVIAIGNGKTAVYHVPTNKTLRHGPANVVPTERCETAFRFIFHPDMDSIICVRSPSGQDAYNGDSGTYQLHTKLSGIRIIRTF